MHQHRQAGAAAVGDSCAPNICTEKLANRRAPAASTGRTESTRTAARSGREWSAEPVASIAGARRLGGQPVTTGRTRRTVTGCLRRRSGRGARHGGAHRLSAGCARELRPRARGRGGGGGPCPRPRARPVSRATQDRASRLPQHLGARHGRRGQQRPATRRTIRTCRPSTAPTRRPPRAPAAGPASGSAGVRPASTTRAVLDAGKQAEATSARAEARLQPALATPRRHRARRSPARRAARRVTRPTAAPSHARALGPRPRRATASATAIGDTDYGAYDGSADARPGRRRHAVPPLHLGAGRPSTATRDRLTRTASAVDERRRLAAGHYLCRPGWDLSDQGDLRKAFLSRNDPTDYLNTVLPWLEFCRRNPRPDPRRHRPPARGPQRRHASLRGPGSPPAPGRRRARPTPATAAPARRPPRPRRAPRRSRAGAPRRAGRRISERARRPAGGTCPAGRGPGAGAGRAGSGARRVPWDARPAVPRRSP
ncbi:hypothetical protein SALBM217S_01636 [Streptomyces griseoloalbus]